MERLGRSHLTIARHNQNYKIAKNWFRNRHINSSNIDSFVIYLLNKNKRATVNSAIATLKCYFNFIFERGLIKENYSSHLKYVKADPFSPIVLSVRQIDQIINCPRAWGTFDAIDRYKYDVFFELLARCGLRCNEAINMRLQDFDFDNDTIRVTGKGTKVRLVAIAPVLKYRLLACFKSKSMSSTDYIFLGPSGERANPAMFRSELKKRLKVLGMNPGIHLHTFRHSFATQATIADKNLIKLMRALGHANIQTTLKYVHLNVDDIRDVFDDNPINRLPEIDEIPEKVRVPYILAKNSDDFKVN